MECTSFHSVLLKINQNLIINVNRFCINKLLNNGIFTKGKDIFEIQRPCTRQKPKSIISEWPPHNKCYFEHDYYHGTSKKFFSVGDHIASFKPNHKEAVLALNRLGLMVLFSEKPEHIWYFKKVLASVKCTTKFTIFTDINFSSIQTEYTNHLKSKINRRGVKKATIKTCKRKTKLK